MEFEVLSFEDPKVEYKVFEMGHPYDHKKWLPKLAAEAADGWKVKCPISYHSGKTQAFLLERNTDG